MKNLFLIFIYFFYLILPKLNRAQCNKGSGCEILNMDEFVSYLEIPEELETFKVVSTMIRGAEGNFYFNKTPQVREKANTDIFCQLEEYMPVLKIRPCPGEKCEWFPMTVLLEKDTFEIFINSGYGSVFIYDRKELAQRRKERMKDK